MTVRHPAKFSKALLPELAKAVEGVDTVLDPFAGVGTIHRLRELANVTTIGVEIEPEWARQSPHTIIGNALALPFGDATFDAIVTSPCYGNRLADHHDARDGSERRSYKHDLGRDPHPESAATMRWGRDYMRFHERAWMEAYRVLCTYGLFVLNVSDHVRNGHQVPVVAWHVDCLTSMDMKVTSIVPVPTRRLKQGANRDARVACELIFVFEKLP